MLAELWQRAIFTPECILDSFAIWAFFCLALCSLFQCLQDYDTTSKGCKIASARTLDDAPHTEHADLFNQDFRHAGQTDDLTIYQAEYAFGSRLDLECLHCLLADQLVGEDDETPWLSAPVMAAYVSLAEREDGVPVRLDDDAICILENRQKLYPSE